MIEDLSRDEKKALIAIVKFIANRDHKLEGGELDEFNKIAEQEGFEDFHELFKEVDREVTSLKDLSKVTNGVTRRSAQEDIVALGLAMARADGVESAEEHDVIKYISRVWNVELAELAESRQPVLVQQIVLLIRGVSS